MHEEHLGIVLRDPDELDGLGEQIDTETVHALEKGLSVGVPAGVLAGVAIFAIAIPGGALGIGGALAAGAAAGLGFGSYVGALAGLEADKGLEEEEPWEDLKLDPGQVLVAVHAKKDPKGARAILERNGGHVIER